MTGVGPALPPPGWHPDPSRRHELRYWDGTRWSEHVADGGQTGTDPLSPPAPTDEPAATVDPADGLGAATVATPSIVPVPLAAPPPSVPAATAEGVLDPAAAWQAPTPAAGAPPVMMRSIGGLAASLTVVLWIMAAVSAFATFAFFNRAVVADDIFQGDFVSFDRADRADDLVSAAFLGLLVASLAIFVLLIIWMWRVAKNAQLAGRLQPRFAPGWTIGGWFIPFANLVIPVLVMQDLWRGSDPTIPHGDAGWRRAKGSALVGWWWAAYIVSSMRFLGGQDAQTFDDLENVRLTDSLAGIGALAAIAAAVLLIFVVRRITRRQEALFAGRPVVT